MGLERLHAFEVITENAGSTVRRAVQVLDGGLERPVVVKVLRGVTPDRAIRELKLTMILGEHPNIVTVHEISQVDGTPCVIMEYCPHGSLASRCGRMPVAHVIAVGIAVADALAFAHARDVLHRDVKPGNVLIRGDVPEQSSSYVLADFGIAGLWGNAGFYASPQRLGGESPTVADDIWALGATLFTLIDGTPPFAVADDAADDAADDVAAYTLRVVGQPPRDLRRAGVPSELRQAIGRCLDPEPAGRFGSAAELRETLAAIQLPGTEAVPSALAFHAPTAPTDDLTALTAPTQHLATITSPAHDLAAVVEPQGQGRVQSQGQGGSRFAGRRVLRLAAVACTLLAVVAALVWAGFTRDRGKGPVMVEQSRLPVADALAPGAPQAPPSDQPTSKPTAATLSPASAPANPPGPQASAGTQAPPPRMVASLPAKQCEVAFRHGDWAADLCFHLETDGKTVYGYLDIKCHTATHPQIDCKEFRIGAVELFSGVTKLASVAGGSYKQPELTTGRASAACVGGTTYYLKGRDLAVRGPDGEWAGPDSPSGLNGYRCLAG